jgi:hypothetical protein
VVCGVLCVPPAPTPPTPVAPAGYFITGRTNMNTGPPAEHAPNGNGMTFALVWFGGKIRNPAAVTGLHWDAGRLRTFTIWSSAVTVCPWFRADNRRGQPSPGTSGDVHGAPY